MKQSVKTIVDSIEKEIEHIKNHSYLFEEHNSHDWDFVYGKIYFEIEIHNKKEIGGDWDEIISTERVKITLNHIQVTNENSKVLTNLSTEVFNQLEKTYTNY